jgi:transmembrane protein 231
MPIEVHREPLYRRYYAPYFSASFLFAAAVGFLLVFLPLIIAYNSSGFWYKEDTYFEQPLIKYKYQGIIEVYGTNEATKTPLSLYYSTSSFLNQQHSSTLRSSLIQSAELDDDMDGVNDRIEVSVLMPLQASEQVMGMSMMFTHDIKIQNRARYSFDSATLIQHEASSAIVDVKIDGDLMVRQTWPLSTRGGFKAPYSGSPLMSESISVGTPVSDFEVNEIMSQASARNLSINFVPRFKTARRTTDAPSVDLGGRTFNATITMRIPHQPIWVTPSVSEVLKDAWMQYVAFFIVVAFLLYRMSSFVFRYRLLETYTTADVVREKMD